MKNRYTAKVSNGTDQERVYVEAHSKEQVRSQLIASGKITGYEFIGEIFECVPKNPPTRDQHIGYLNIYQNEDGTLKAGGMYSTREGANSVAKPYRFRLGIVVWE